MKHKVIILIVFVLAVSLLSNASFGGDEKESEGNKGYRIAITNITPGLDFTHFIIATHKKGLEKLFTPGSPASADLVRIAEGGDTDGLEATYEADSNVKEIMITSGLLEPGQSVTVEIPYHKHYRYITLAAMLLPTNDGFVALNGVKGPKRGKSVMYLSPGYDAGSETNDQLCANIPGPDCGGAGPSPLDDGEGYVHIHSGIHGIGDLLPENHDWRNPVARIVITKVSMDDDE